MTTMTLFHSPLSPFVRKVMVVLHETGQPDRVTLQAVNVSPVNGDDQLNQDNPIGKIPALRLEDGTVLHDSRVICEYLDLQHVGNPLIPREGSARWRRLTLASQADGGQGDLVARGHIAGTAQHVTRHQRERRGHGHVTDRPLLGIHHAADEVARRADQLRHDEVAQGQGEREDRPSGDTRYRKWQHHQHKGCCNLEHWIGLQQSSLHSRANQAPTPLEQRRLG